MPVQSGIVLKSEADKGGFKLLINPWTESHEDLVAIHNLKDTRLNFARVEFSPVTMATADKVETYRLRIDEVRRSDWFDGEMEESVTEKMAAYIKSIIVTGEVSVLIGGQFILATGAKIGTAKTCIMNAVTGSAEVGSMTGSAKVGNMYGSAKVENDKRSK